MLFAITLAAVGCGSSSVDRPTADRPTADRPRLTAQETSRIAEYEYDFSATVLDSSEYAGTLRGVDYLIALCRAKPRAVYRVGDDDPPRTVMQVTEDAANTLREYQRELAAKLDRVLDDGCR